MNKSFAMWYKRCTSDLPRFLISSCPSKNSFLISIFRAISKPGEQYDHLLLFCSNAKKCMFCYGF